MKAIILTLLAAAAVYLAGNARVQLWDRDEPRYAQCSRQMLQSGDWVVPRLYDKLRFQKPPLIYWCQASAMRLLGSEGGRGAFAARLPSAVAMLLTLLILAIAISRSVDAQAAAWTDFVMATSLMTLVAAKTCLTDSVLLLFIVIGQLCLYAIWQGNRSWFVAIILAVMCGLGWLTKGPFMLGICGCTAGALGVFHLCEKFLTRQRSDHSLMTGPANGKYWILAAQILLGVAIILAMVLPWYSAVKHRAPDFLSRQLAEAEAHAVGGKEGHHFPPGYHLLVVWPMFMPWSLLLPMAIGVGIRDRSNPQVRFALAAVVGPWLMVECLGTKLPHYLLPAYPAMAFLVAHAIGDCLAAVRAETPACGAANPNGLGSPPFMVGAAVWALIITIIGLLPWLAAGSFRIGGWHIGAAFYPLPWLGMIGLTAFGLVFAGSVFVLLQRQKFASAFVAMGLGMFVVMMLAFTCYFPDAEFLRISVHVAEVLKKVGATNSGDVKMVGYLEPSLAFYQGGTVREVEKRMDLVKQPMEFWPHWVVMSRDVWNLLTPQQRGQLKIVDTCRGLAYSDGGKVQEVLVVEKTL